MSATPGQDAKEKGNEAFKASDFPAAIGHYTAAVLADPKNPTYTLNRAAAYLRLGKHDDAERDCDVTINLDAKNVKAWFRRAQARVGSDKLEGARDDFKRTLVLDPSNAAAKQELEKVEALLKYRREALNKKRTPIEVTSLPLGAKPSLSSTLPSATTSSATPKRRRVPIKIVDTSATASSSTAVLTSTPAVSSKPSATIAESNAPAQAKSSATAAPSDDLMKPVSTRTLTPAVPPPASSSSTPASKASSFKDLKQAREANKTPPVPTNGSSTTHSAPSTTQSNKPRSPPVRPGGGIFRANGQHTVFGSPAPAPAEATQSNTTTTPKTSGQQGPLTLFVFSRTWSTLSASQEKWRFLLDNVPPASLPSMFKTSLEAPQLVSMLETFKFVLHDPEFEYEPDVKETVKRYLINFSRVPRFSTIAMLMSKDEKKVVTDVWDALDRVDDQIESEARKVWGVN